MAQVGTLLGAVVPPTPPHPNVPTTPTPPAPAHAQPPQPAGQGMTLASQLLNVPTQPAPAPKEVAAPCQGRSPKQMRKLPPRGGEADCAPTYRDTSRTSDVNSHSRGASRSLDRGQGHRDRSRPGRAASIQDGSLSVSPWPRASKVWPRHPRFVVVCTAV